MYTIKQLEGMSNRELMYQINQTRMLGSDAEYREALVVSDPWEKVCYSRDSMIEFLSCLTVADVRAKLESLEANHDKWFYQSDSHSTYMKGSDESKRIYWMKNFLEMLGNG